MRRVQGAGDVAPIFGRELIVGLWFAKVAVKDFQRPEAGQVSDEVFKIAGPLWVSGVVGTGETERVFALIQFDRIMHGGLAGKGQHVDAFMSQRAFIAVDAVNIRGEHVVKVLGGAEECLEMHRVFFVPEDGWHLILPAPLQEASQFLAVLRDLVMPTVILAAPCRLDKQQVGLK